MEKYVVSARKYRPTKFEDVVGQSHVTTTLQNAIKNGFSKAFSTIIDANITTLLVAVILYAIGTGPIKGFAVTLSIGIVTSVFTAIFVTRSLVNFIYGYRDIKELKV